MYTKKILNLAWPIAISSLSFSIMTIVDMYFVGHFGEEIFAGVALGGTVAWVFSTLPNGIIKTVKPFVSAIYGNPNIPQDEKWIKTIAYTSASACFAGIVGIAYVGVIYLVAPKIAAHCDTASAATAAVTYMTIRSWGYPIMFIQNSFREYQYGIGNTRVNMIGTLVGNIVNMTLNYVSQKHTTLGLHGILYATLIGVLVQATIIIGYQKIYHRIFGKFTIKELKEFLRVGTPQGVQFFLECFAYIVIGLWLSSFSSKEMGAHHIVDRVVLFSFLIVKSIGEGSAVLVGRTVGKNVLTDVQDISRNTMSIIFFYTAGCAIVFVLFAQNIAGLFTESTQTILLVQHLFVYAALFQTFDGAMVVGSCVLRGATDTKFVAKTGIITTWCISIPFVWFFGFFLTQGAQGVWIGLTVGTICKAMFYWHRIITNTWQHTARKTIAAL